MTPSLSIVVVVHNMQREAARTLHTLCAEYQTNVDAGQYEVLVVDSGSSTPLPAGLVASFGSNFRHFAITPRHPSPVSALEFGYTQCRAPFVAFAIDGARMLSPGCIGSMITLLAQNPCNFVYTAGFHLGEQSQQLAASTGYDQKAEDVLLQTVDWKKDGYLLFSIACLAGSSSQGMLNPIAESNLFALSRTHHDAIGGFNARFTSPGGGYVNLDYFQRAMSHPALQPILLLGEGTFHQYHGGAAANAPPDSERHALFRREYESIRGQPFLRPVRRPAYYGRAHPLSQRFL